MNTIRDLGFGNALSLIFEGNGRCLKWLSKVMFLLLWAELVASESPPPTLASLSGTSHLVPKQRGFSRTL